MELIEHIEVGSGGAASITFSSIPADYTDLLVVLSTRSGRSAANEAMRLSFNGSTTGFSDRYMDGTGSSVASGTGSRYAGQAVSTTATSNTFSNVEIYIPNYAGSANKSYSVNSVTENNATFAVQGIIAGLWSNTAAITSIAFTTDFANNFLQYSSASLFGIRKYDTTGSPKATGGIISYDSVNNYWVHTFTASGTFTPTENLTAEYLVIAGGGGGGGGQGASWSSGGGGAGGYRCSVAGESSGGGASAESALSLTASTGYTVTVGAGGSGGATATAGSQGNDSVFSTITSTKGGGGGSTTSQGSTTGGSGGGIAPYPSATGDTVKSGTANQGYSGGNTGSTTRSGGGGGGAGSAGTTNSGTSTRSQAGVAGGAGVTSSITGTAIGRAGGGGSGGYASQAFGSYSAAGGSATDGGGAGGAASPSIAYAGNNGTANKGGGGGGGAGHDGPTLSGTGGNGGSGIVIVRYAA